MLSVNVNIVVKKSINQPALLTMISDSELLRQEPKVGADLFAWKDATDNIQMHVMKEQDATSNFNYLQFIHSPNTN